MKANLAVAPGSAIVILSQAFAYVVRSHPHDRIASRIVGGVAPEHFCPDDPLPQKVIRTGNRLPDQVGQELLASRAGAECGTFCNSKELLLYLQLPRWRKKVRPFCRGCTHKFTTSETFLEYMTRYEPVTNRYERFFRRLFALTVKSPMSRASIFAAFFWTLPLFATDRTFDVVVYGGTAGGATAAVAAAQHGLNVALLEPGNHIGGMVSGGLSNSDVDRQESLVGGLTLKFFQAVGRHYGKPVAWAFEPHVAEQTFTETWNRPGSIHSSGPARQGGEIRFTNPVVVHGKWRFILREDLSRRRVRGRSDESSRRVLHRRPRGGRQDMANP